jgi:hypothetical protein
MKKQILIVILFFSFSFANSQNTIKLYRTTLKANEVLGNGKTWGPKAGENITIMFTRASNELYELIGQIYKTSNLYAVTNFLNTDIETNSPLLDSINFSYYFRYGFLRLEKKYPNLLNEQEYKTFKTSFRSAPLDKDKRALIFDETNKRFKNLLEESRYSTYSPPIAMSITTVISKQIKAGITAEIVDEIKDVFKIKPALAVVLSDSISNHIIMEGAKYHEIKYDDDYIGRAHAILKNLTPTTQVDNSISDEDFYAKFIDFYKSKTSGIITGAAVIEANFDAKKLKDIKSVIGVTLKGNLDPTGNSEQKIMSATADIAAKYVGEKSLNTELSTLPTFYYIRYVYDSRLEIGERADKNTSY